MKFNEILDAFRANLLEKLVKKHGPQPFETCWTELVQNEYGQKVALVTQLIKSGVDCDWRNDKGISPMELALSLNKSELVLAMLEAETARFDVQRMVYRLMRRGNVELLRMFFDMQQVTEADKFRMVSLALEEGAVKRIAIEKNMNDFCQKLILTTFYSTGKIMKLTQLDQHIKERIEIICKEVEFLQSYNTKRFTNMDDNFLVSLGIVAENLFVVGLLWNHNREHYAQWKSLQPNKINYLTVIYLNVLGENLPDLGLAIDKNLLLDMLNMLSSELEVIFTKDYEGVQKMEGYLAKMVEQNNVNEGWKSKYPQVKLTKQHRRFAKKHDTEALTKAGFNTEQQKHLTALVHDKKNLDQLRELWVQEYPTVRLGQRAVTRAAEKGVAGPFSRFSRRTRYIIKIVNKIYSRVRNYYSLTVMLSHIQAIYNIALTEKITKEFGYAAFKRIVQIMGEFCKNTKQTPNLQGSLHEHMSLWSSQSFLEVFHRRRNVVTHGLSLTEVNFRILQNSGELNASILLAYCQMVQFELHKTFPHLKYYQQNELSRLIRGCLGRIWRLKSIEQCKSFAAMMARVKRSSWKDTTAELHDFDEMSSLLNKLMSHREEDRQFYVHLKEVKIKVEQAKTLHEERMSLFDRYHARAWKFIESCGNYCDYNILNRSVDGLLNLSQKYYAHGCEDFFLQEANQLLVKIIESKLYSKDMQPCLLELNRLLVNRVDVRESRLKMAHQFSQFVPYQNERYTEQLLEALGVKDLRFEKFYTVHDALDSRVYDPLNKKGIGMFEVEKKFNIIKSVLRQNHIKYDPQMLDEYQKQDCQLMQHLLKQMLESLYKLSRVKVDSEDQYFEARVLATDYGLLEVCTILSHTEPFQSNFDYFNTPMPLLAGRYLRNALAHDFVPCKSAFFFDQDTISQTIEVLYEQRSSLLNGQNKSSALPHFGEISEKYKRRKRFAEDQTIPTKGKLSSDILNSRLDIYGHYFFIWKGDTNFYHNLLDVLLYYYTEEAIAYIEERSQQNKTTSASSVFSHLWNRLRYSHLLGWPLQTIVRLWSIGGQNIYTAIHDGLAEATDRIWQDNARYLGVTFENYGYNPPEQIEKILCYFLLVERFDKFLDFFHRYDKKFDFIKFHTLLSDIPDVVDKLAEFLPWGSAKDQGFSMMHSLCASNNVEALGSAIKRLSSTQLCILSKDGFTPIQVATRNSSLGAVRVLLESRKHTQLDYLTLDMIFETHQNDLLKYFIPFLESDQPNEIFSECEFSIFPAANIKAYEFLTENLSKKAFQRVCPDDGTFSQINMAIASNTKQTLVKDLLADSKLKSSANRGGSPMLIDVVLGRFKFTNILLSNGFAVDYSVIKAAVSSNCFKRLKWLLRKSEVVLTDSQQQEICKKIISEGRDLRMLKYFTGFHALPADDLTNMLELTIHHFFFDSCRFLCETFPQILQNYNRPLGMHPLTVAIDRIHHRNSLARDRPFLNFLIEKFTNIARHETVLFDALNLNDLQIVQALVDAGVPVDVETAGFTPLTVAGQNCVTYPNAQAYAIFELLLKKGVCVQNLMFCKPRYLRTVRLLELLIQHTSFGAASAELLIVLLQVQAIGSDRVMQALLQKFKFLAATLSFERDEPLVLDSQFKLDLSQYEFDWKIDGIIEACGYSKFDFTKLFR